MAFVLVRTGCGVSLVDDQDAVEEYAADGFDEAFGDRIGSRRPRTGVRMILASTAVKTGIEGGGELGVVVADQDRKERAASSRSMSRLRAC